MLDLLAKYEAQNVEQHCSESDPFTQERYSQFHRFMPEHVRTVLDVGCNTGRGGQKLKDCNSNYQLTALDCVRSRLDALPNCYSKVICGLANAIPTKDQSFDAIVAGEFLEHLYPSDVDPTLCEFQRVLKIGGRLLITTPNPSYLRLWLTGGTVYGVGHLTQHWPHLLKNRFKMHGFSRVRIFGSGKMTRYIGCYFPLRSLYGSYLVIGDKI